MILYTALPPYDNIFSTEKPLKTSYHSVTDGIIETVGSGKSQKVRRLISTNPYAYLNKTYSPGAIFK